jgi:hypothetical protein
MRSGLKSNSHEKYFGFFRAKVVEIDLSVGKPDNQSGGGFLSGAANPMGGRNKDEKNDYGAIKVFIPDVQTDIDPDFDESKSKIIAFPANSPMGGYNEDEEDSHFQSAVFVPRKGSWVWVFFEQGRLDRAFYWGGFNYQQAMLPPENRDGDEPHKVVTLVKTGEGRAIILSDDKKNCRVEITGKKRKMKEGPEGDKDSVYKIDDNQTTILLDERQGKEKLLIRTHKGDFINLDIEKQELHAKFKGDITVKTDGDLYFNAGKGVHIKSGQDMNLQSGKKMNIKSGSSCSVSAGMNLTLSGKMMASLKASGVTIVDAAMVLIQSALAGCMGGGGGSAKTKDPKGDRDSGGMSQMPGQLAQRLQNIAGGAKDGIPQSNSPLLEKSKTGKVFDAEGTGSGANPLEDIEDLQFTDPNIFSGKNYDTSDFSDIVETASVGKKFDDIISSEKTNWNVLL